ncbi:MAG: hypothetical protein ACR2O3_14325 [Rhizobiaceae bacterium]
MPDLRTLLLALVLATLVSAGFGLPNTAHAEPRIDRHDLSFHSRSGAIEVIAADGAERWNELKSSSLEISGLIYLELKGIRGYDIRDISVHLGHCAGWEMCRTSAFPVIANTGFYSPTLGVVNTLTTDTVDPSEFPGAAANALSPNGQSDKIKGKCNDFLTSPDSLHEEFETEAGLDVTILVHLFATSVWTSPSVVYLPQHSTLRADVICKQIADPPEPIVTDDLGYDPGGFSLTDLRVFLATNSNATSQPNAATVCKKGKLTVRANTNQEGFASIRLYKKIGPNPITSEIKQIWAKRQADGTFVGRHEEWLEVDSTSNVQAYAEEVRNPNSDDPFYQQTQWESLQLTCSGAGGGGLAQPTEPSNFAVSSTDLKYNMIDNGKCPRKIWETITFRTNGPGRISYELKHSGGLVLHRGEAQAQLYDGQFKAVVQRTFQMQETDMELNVIPEGFESAQSGWKRLNVKCEIENSGASASGELSSGATEPPDIPPSQKITGDFQFLDNSGETQCPRKVRGVINFQLKKQENVHYSLDCNSGSHPSGIIQPTAGNNGNFIAPALVSVDLKPGKNGKSKLVCALKARENGIMTLKKVKGRDFDCVKRNPDAGDTVDGLSSGSNNQSSGSSSPQPEEPKPQVAVCKGGNLRGGKCYCPQNTKRKKISRFEHVCKPDKIVEPVRTNPDKSKETKLICKDGKVRNGKCACGSKNTLKKLGKRKFQCVAKPVRTNPDKPKKAKLVCKDGKVRNGKCACGSKKTLMKLGKLKFQCIAKPVGANSDKPKKAKMVCSGGKIRSGKCSCGSKKTLKKLGKSKFQCVAKPARVNPGKPKKAKLTCKGGKIKNGRCKCKKGRKLIRGICAKIAG